MSALVVVLIIIAVLVVAGVLIYNSLVRARARTDEAWSDISVQLKRRYDLIPNLVESVKGYATHEKTVFEDVTVARANALNAQTVKEAAQADNQFQTALKSLFAVAEAYPQLRATENFQQLQRGNHRYGGQDPSRSPLLQRLCPRPEHQDPVVPNQYLRQYVRLQTARFLRCLG